MKDIDADYYGYRDEDDGRLLPLEKEAEENGNWFLTVSFITCFKLPY